MVRICFLFLILPLFSFSQELDTLDKGNLEVVDSVAGLKIIYPFKDRKLEGAVNAFYLSDNQMAHTVNYVNNQKQGDWSYFVYDTAGYAHRYQHFTYVNDTLNGYFVRLTDSLREIGYYQQGQLDSIYTTHILSWDSLFDTTSLLVDSGTYKAGIKEGYWYHYTDGNLKKEGFYKEDKPSGKWRIYEGPSNELSEEVTFEKGILHGPQIIYLHLETTPCGEGCLDSTWTRREERITWNNKIKNGPYLLKNTDDQEVESGNFMGGKKQGSWTFHDYANKKEEIITFHQDIQEGPYELKIAGVTTQKGSYNQEQKDGKWSIFDGVHGKLIREESWEADKANGEWKYFEKGKLKVSKKFEDDQLTELFEYDRTGVELHSLWIKHRSDRKMHIKYETLTRDSLLLIHYLYTPGSEYSHENFLSYFKTNLNVDSIFVREGKYEVKKGGSTEVKGAYQNNLQEGTWSYFFNSSITWQKNFKAGLLESELFVDSHNGEALPKGEYILWYGPERPKMEFKIKEGVRNGKSTWYGPDGKEERSEKYKDGVLQ